MNLLLRTCLDDSSSDDDDDFEMVAILLAGIAMSKQDKRRGSMPRRKVVRRKLFDDYYSTDDESMVCSTFSGTIASAKKKPLRRRLTTTAGSRLARRLRTHDLVGHAGCEDSVPVMDLPAADEAPLTGRQKRKAWMHAELKAKEVQGGENSEEEEVGTEDGLDPAGLAKRREAKPNPKYLGPEWVR